MTANAPVSLAGMRFTVSVGDGVVTYEVSRDFIAFDPGTPSEEDLHLVEVTRVDGGPDDWRSSILDDRGIMEYDKAAALCGLHVARTDVFNRGATAQSDIFGRDRVAPSAPSAPRFSKGDRVRLAGNLRPTYLQGTVATVLGWRRGRYDIELPINTKLRRFSGVKTRADDSWLEPVK